MRLAALRSLAFLSRQLRRCASLIAYAAAGLIRRAEMQRAIEAEWNGYARSAWISHPHLMEAEQDFYMGQLRLGERVLVVGCGGGRDLIALLERGLTVDGLDIAGDALAICRRNLETRGLTARLYATPAAETKFDAVYDAAVFSWFCYGFIPESAARVATLRAIHAALRPQGRVLLTYQPVGATSRLPATLARWTARLSGADWTPEYGDVLEISMSPGGIPSVHYEHRFSEADVSREAQAAGLRVLSNELREEGRAVLVRD